MKACSVPELSGTKPWGSSQTLGVARISEEHAESDTKPIKNFIQWPHKCFWEANKQDMKEETAFHQCWLVFWQLVLATGVLRWLFLEWGKCHMSIHVYRDSKTMQNPKLLSRTLIWFPFLFLRRGGKTSYLMRPNHKEAWTKQHDSLWKPLSLLANTHTTQNAPWVTNW